MKRDAYNLFMSYDHEGFETALSHCETSDRDECLTIDRTSKLLTQLVSDGLHDYLTNNCTSFQIYNEDGKCLYNFPDDFKAICETYSTPDISMTLDEALSGKLEDVLGIAKDGKESA